MINYIEPITPAPLDPEDVNRALVLVPHPDDESIGCGGLLAALADLGIPVRVILVSDGSGAGGLPPGSSEIRFKEFLAALNVLGKSISYEWWMLPDGSLKDCHGMDALLIQSIVRFEPTLLVAPWLYDLHPDHAAVGLLAARVNQEIKLPQGVLFYEVWSPLPANFFLSINTYWSKKKFALSCHKTALECGNYPRAMEGLASYRSLLSGHLAADGEYAEAYFATRWKPLKSRSSARYATADDAEQISCLHHEVFNSHVNSSWWKWKYSSQGISGTVFEDQKKVVGFYGTLERIGMWEGKEIPASQQADVMVSVKYRFGTRRNGVFSRMSRLLLEEHLGKDKKYAVCFGFPTIRALHLGIRLGLYISADEVYIASHRVFSRSRTGLLQYKKVDPASSIRDYSWVDSLQENTPTGSYFWLRKDSEYWCWRFAGHPEKKYLVMRVFSCGKLCAAAVLLENGETLEIIDYALKSWRYIKLLKSEVENVCLDLGLENVSIWGTMNLLQAFSFSSDENIVHAGYLALPGSKLDSDLSVKIKGNGWFIGGDTDFR